MGKRGRPSSLSLRLTSSPHHLQREKKMPEKQTIRPRISRREAMRLAGAAGAAALVGRQIIEAPADAQSTTTSCVVSPALTEGPYFVEEKLERSDIRTDPMDNTVSA